MTTYTIEKLEILENQGALTVMEIDVESNIATIFCERRGKEVEVGVAL